MPTLGELARLVGDLAPPELAEPWDNVGLLLGDPARSIARVVCCLDLDARVLELAAGGAVVAFHPPLFRPIQRLRADDPETGLLLRAAECGIGLIATHTALDSVPGGTSDRLAERLGVAVTGVLRPRDADQRKLAVFCPPEAVDAVAAAISAAGAGRIGRYAECGFRVAGVGTFRGLAGSTPTVGTVGRLERVDEIRLEMVVPAVATGRVVDALRAAHPYEEVAFDLVPLLNEAPGTGLGRIGELPAAMALADFADAATKALEVAGTRVVGDADRPVRRVALLGGSGGSFVGDAVRAGADVLVTGDVKHHEALAAQRAGMAIVDPGHAATEHPVVSYTATELAARLPAIDVTTAWGPGDPFWWRAKR